MTTASGPRLALDLRRAPLALIHAIDFRAPARDFWADEVAVWDRLVASWAGLDDAAWRLPGAAPSDAGGPDWSLLDHLAHVLDWQEIAIDYIERVGRGDSWPTDEDYDGGDFDTFNEGRRERFAALSPAVLRARFDAGHQVLLAAAHRLPMETIHSDAAWGWVYNVLHGHGLDHLRVVEPWADALRRRQIQNDPFGPDPQPVASDLDAARARFWADEASVAALFEATLRDLPEAAWTEPDVTPGWTIADHVGHLASWFEETADVLAEHDRTGTWRELPPEGVDAWNEARVVEKRGTPVSELLDAYASGRGRLIAAARGLSDADWLDPEGFSWVYEDLHGHVRAHVAMIGPFAARAAWPKPGDQG